MDVQDRVRVDASLQIGTMADTVEVQTAAPLLETDTSSLGQVVDSQRIVDLPLNGRFFTRLAVLTPAQFPRRPARATRIPADSAPTACGLTRTISFWMAWTTTAFRKIW